MARITAINQLASTRTARWMAASVMVVGGIMASVSAADAWAERRDGEGTGMRHIAHHPGMGGGFMLGGKGLERLLDDVQASDAQRAQIKQIADSARADLEKLRAGNEPLHDQTLTLLTQPQVDAVAAEKLRQQMLARHDAVTKRVLTAMLDTSKVLTPEQRVTLAQKLKERQDKRDHGHFHRPGQPAEGAAPTNGTKG